MEKQDNPFLPLQKMMDTWLSFQKSWLQGFAQKPAEGDAPTEEGKGFEGGAPRALFDGWLRMMEEASRQFGAASPFPGLQGQVFDNVRKSAESYAGFLRWTTDMLGRIQGKAPDEAYRVFYEEWMKAYRTSFGDFMKDFGDLAGAGDAVRTMLEMGNMEGTALADFARQMTEASEGAGRAFVDYAAAMQKGFVDFAAGKVGPEWSRELFTSWQRLYESTFGRFVKIPPLGIARGATEDYDRSVDAFMKYQAALAGFAFEFMVPAFAVMDEVVKKGVELSRKELTPKEVKEFYEFAVGAYERRSLELFKSEEFLRLMQLTLDAALDFWASWQKLVEDQLRMYPVATRSEMTELYEELDRMRRRLDELEKAAGRPGGAGGGKGRPAKPGGRGSR